MGFNSAFKGLCTPNTQRYRRISVLILYLISICIAVVSSEQLHCIDQKKTQKFLDVSCTAVHTK